MEKCHIGELAIEVIDQRAQHVEQFLLGRSRVETELDLLLTAAVPLPDHQ